MVLAGNRTHRRPIVNLMCNRKTGRKKQENTNGERETRKKNENAPPHCIVGSTRLSASKMPPHRPSQFHAPSHYLPFYVFHVIHRVIVVNELTKFDGTVVSPNLGHESISEIGKRR